MGIRKQLARLALAVVAAAAFQRSFAADAQPAPDPPFAGKIGLSTLESVPAWPQPVTAPAGAPNIVLILLDDVGFGDAATFGGPAATPALDKLAAQGLRYNQFHTTAICSATRAALLSGRNHHRMGFGTVGESGYPGYNGVWKKSTVSVAEVLRRNGYSTAAFGKWHNTPSWEVTPVGPFDRWPTGLGFEYFYGDMWSNGSQWEPMLWRNTERVAPPYTVGRGVHLTTILVDEAVNWIHTHDSLIPDKPYFIYFAPEAAHSPHHVDRAWIEKYRGKFDQGWDKLREEIFARQKKLGVIPSSTALTPRPSELPAWNSLSAKEKHLYAHQMEVFAAYLEQTDYEVGRLIEVAQRGAHGDNTLILYIVGDNGDEAALGLDGTDNVEAELRREHRSVQSQLADMDELGGPRHFNVYASAWAWAGSTPFQWVKNVASHFGGTRNPLIVSWPARIKEGGGLRSQFTHVNDVAATLYDVAGIGFPEKVDGVAQLPLDGVSFADTFTDPNASAKHRVQYFEMEGNRAIYQDGWLAAARHGVPWLRVQNNEFLASGKRASASDLLHDPWELYHVVQDFSEAHDLAKQYPEKLKALQALFDEEARRNDVYPLDVGVGSGAGHPLRVPVDRREYVYFPGFPGGGRGPNFAARHRITADVLIPDRTAAGVIIASGGRFGGFSLYLKDEHLFFEDNLLGESHDVLGSTEPLPTGRVTVSFEFIPDPSDPESHAGTARLRFGDRVVGEARLLHHNAGSAGWDIGVDIGENSPSPVSAAYASPFKFTGTLEKVTVTME